ncbi:MAG: hypothetical protein K0M40_00650 [Prolixibacteraceae bacterium]|nr:hypothetical protein [Prolixibacteraceae bacterium]
MKTIFLLSTFILGLIFISSAQGNLTITEPRNGSTVAQMNGVIKVSASQGLPVGKSLVVFVQDPNGNWWPYINANPNSSRTIWVFNGVQFGVASDKDMTFNIQAIVTSNNIRTQGLGIPKNSDGGSYSTENLNLINSNHSAIITVTRK